MENETEPKPEPPQTEPPEDPVKALEAMARGLLEAGTYFADYLKTRVDLAQLSVRESFRAIGLAILKLWLVGACLMIALALALYGLSSGVGEMLGGRTWLGFVIVGLGLSLGLMLALKQGAARRRNKALEERLQNYEKKETRE